MAKGKRGMNKQCQAAEQIQIIIRGTLGIESKTNRTSQLSHTTPPTVAIHATRELFDPAKYSE